MAKKKAKKEPKVLKFKCSHCGNDSLHSVENVTLAYPIKTITEDGIDAYGDHEDNYGGDGVQYYACRSCGGMLKDEDDHIITSDVELVEWLKTNCEQEE